MLPEQQWEYLVVHASNKRTADVVYTGPGEVASDAMPYEAVEIELGSFGGKGWELVSVVGLLDPEIGRVTDYYFKRPHNPNRSLKD